MVPYVSEMEFDVVYCLRIKHQGVEALSWLPTDGEGCNSIYNALLVMLVSSISEDGRKGCIKHNDVIDDCCSKRTAATDPGLAAMW